MTKIGLTVISEWYVDLQELSKYFAFLNSVQ